MTRAPVPSKSPAQRAGVWPKLLVSIALGALFAWIAERGGVPIFPKGSSFRAVDWPQVGLASVLLVLVTVLRATRWRFLIAPVKRVPLAEVVVTNWVGFFAIFALPLRLGELVRPALSKLRSGIPISAGLGTVAVERVLDGTITSLCVAWSLWALPRLDTRDPIARAVPFYAGVVLGVFCCALVALGAFLWQRDLAVRITERVFSTFSPRLGGTLARKVDSVADGLRSIGDAKLAAGFVVESLLYWGINACFMWVLGRAAGLPMELGHATAVMGVLALGILLPSGPGLFGSFQVAVSAALKLYFPEALVSTQGSVFVFLLYLLNAVLMVLIGVIPLMRMHIRLGALIAPRITDSELPPPRPRG
ncbi:MAG: lysylphosphatidylglycerol synthase transmembrane domain-containing protein [Polyangiales bacterium]